MNLTENEIKTLYCVAENSDETCQLDLTHAQYVAACRSLKEKEFINAAFIEGGDVDATRMLSKGKAALDDIKRDEKRKFLNILNEYELTEQEYYVLLYLEGDQSYKTYFDDMDDEDELDAFAETPYIREPETFDDGYALSRQGKMLLNKIRASMRGDNADIKNSAKKNKKQQEPSGILIAEGRVVDFIKVIKAMWDDGIFVDENGKRYPITKFMKGASSFFNCKSLNNYSTTLYNSAKGHKNTYLDTFDELKQQAEKFIKEKEKRKQRK